MYYSEEEIKKSDTETRFNNLFDQSDYERGQIEELECTVLILRKALSYVCMKLNLSDRELHDLHSGYLPSSISNSDSESI